MAISQVTDAELNRVLRDLRPGASWTVVRSKIGSSGRALVCSTTDQTVFVKFGGSAAAVARLASAGVTPGLLATGDSAVGPFVVQEYLEGRTPDGCWIEQNFEAVAEIFRRVHSDTELSRFAMPVAPEVFARSLEIRVEDLQKRCRLRAENPRWAQRICVKLHERLPGSLLMVPTHGDPNARNFLLAEERLFLLDWDDLRMSDPYRDVGQVLWWYVRPEHWSAYAVLAGCDYDAEAKTRMRWWVAAESLDVAVWLMEHNNATAQDFLVDADAVLSGRGNPHAWWLRTLGTKQRE